MSLLKAMKQLAYKMFHKPDKEYCVICGSTGHIIYLPDAHNKAICDKCFLKYFQ